VEARNYSNTRNDSLQGVVGAYIGRNAGKEEDGSFVWKLRE
jgi:hypothetical protein